MFAVLRVEAGLTPGFTSDVERSVPGPCLIRGKVSYVEDPVRSSIANELPI